jgi:hypothetical protein
LSFRHIFATGLALVACSGGGGAPIDAGTRVAAVDAGRAPPRDCTRAAVGTACDDLDPFTVADVCVSGACAGQRLSLEILEALGASGLSFLAPDDRAAVTARLALAPELEPRLRWKVIPRGKHTGPAKILTGAGAKLVFQPSSRIGNGGSRAPNPALAYDVTAQLELGGKWVDLPAPKKLRLVQTEADVLRQEYRDHGAAFQPTHAQIGPPARPQLNTGNYAVVAQEKSKALEALLDGVNAHVNQLLNNDVQKQPVGRRGLPRATVVVDPGPAINEVGPLGDSDPQGDDECAQPKVKGVCRAAILAGPNGIAETRANNRGVRIDVEPYVASAFRNPQRNRAVGSAAVNSRHTRGLALDIDPRPMKVRGKSSHELMCLVEQAGEGAVGKGGKSFTERGAVTFLDCDDPLADHVHVQL